MEHGAAGIAEDQLHLLVDERLDDDLGAAQLARAAIRPLRSSLIKAGPFRMFYSHCHLGDLRSAPTSARRTASG
jgi:hypothetical protein